MQNDFSTLDSTTSLHKTTARTIKNVWVMWVCKYLMFSYLDLGFDFPSDPEASFPLLFEEKKEVDDFSFPNDGLGTRFLPV